MFSLLDSIGFILFDGLNIMQEEIKKALDVLYQGGVVLYPTDTEWALGCDATNEKAVARIREIKKNVNANDLIVLIDNPGKLQSYVDEVPDIAWDLIEMTEKPLTIIYPMARNLALSLLADDKSIAIRVTNEAFSKNLCMRFKRPVVLASAAVAGTPMPANFSQISDEIKSAVDYVVNFRQDDRSQPVTPSIIKLGKGNLFQLIRE